MRRRRATRGTQEVIFLLMTDHAGDSLLLQSRVKSRIGRVQLQHLGPDGEESVHSTRLLLCERCMTVVTEVRAALVFQVGLVERLREGPSMAATEPLIVVLAMTGTATCCGEGADLLQWLEGLQERSGEVPVHEGRSGDVQEHQQEASSRKEQQQKASSVPDRSYLLGVERGGPRCRGPPAEHCLQASLRPQGLQERAQVYGALHTSGRQQFQQIKMGFNDFGSGTFIARINAPPESKSSRTR
jgi:hypothetical protein